MNVISKQIDNLLCIIMLVSSSIHSSKKSERTSTVINTESFIILRSWKMFFVIINSMSEMKEKYVSAWFFMLFMISNAFNNFCLISDLVKFSTQFSAYCEMCALTQWLKRKICNDWHLNVTYWKTMFKLIICYIILIFVIIFISSQKSIFWYDMTWLLIC